LRDTETYQQINLVSIKGNESFYSDVFSPKPINNLELVKSRTRRAENVGHRGKLKINTKFYYENLKGIRPLETPRTRG
jgi:hypothetical protein